MWWQAISSLVSSAASAYGANKSAKQSRDNSREQRAWQETMSTRAFIPTAGTPAMEP
jgi:hypothetical protein